MIGKLSEMFVSGGRTVALLESPRSPLDAKVIPSPRGLKSYDLGGVGLKIVVDLDKSCEVRREVLPKHAVCTSNLNRSGPIPVQSVKNPEPANEFDDGSLEEEYTYVTCHVPNKTFTKVYYDGGEGDVGSRKSNNFGVLRRTPPQNFEAEASFPSSSFLSSCNLCGKKLHGKDIYIGEKGFCSPECRSNQIMMDERKEVCRSEAGELSSSPYQREHIFSTGILAL